jgi:hypothetical protein
VCVQAVLNHGSVIKLKRNVQCVEWRHFFVETVSEEVKQKAKTFFVGSVQRLSLNLQLQLLQLEQKLDRLQKQEEEEMVKEKGQNLQSLKKNEVLQREKRLNLHGCKKDDKK